MPTKNKKNLRLRKNRLHNIIDINGYDTFLVGDKYIVATGDYNVDEMTNKEIGELRKGVPDHNGDPYEVDRTPLWDWFTIVNKKTNRIWYCDFSMPYYSSELNPKELVAEWWADTDVPPKFLLDPLPGKMYTALVKQDNTLHKERKDFYLQNNDWDLTFNDCENEMNKRKNWKSQLPVVYANEKNDMGIIVPFSFKHRTIKDVFQESIDLFFNSKQSNKEDFYWLIEEPEYKKFIA